MEGVRSPSRRSCSVLNTSLLRLLDKSSLDERVCIACLEEQNQKSVKLLNSYYILCTELNPRCQRIFFRFYGKAAISEQESCDHDKHNKKHQDPTVTSLTSMQFWNQIAHQTSFCVLCLFSVIWHVCIWHSDTWNSAYTFFCKMRI